MPAKLPVRKLGKNGPSVAAMGFGTMGLSIGYGKAPDDEERFKVLDRCYELGATFWDSANMYADSEDLIGKWFKRTGKRNEIFLATKFGIAPGMGDSIDSSAENCRRCIKKSLERLGVDYVDLYYMHRANPETPIEETMRAMAQLKAEGKIRHIGLSEVSSTTLRRAYAIAPVAVVQMEYSPFDRDIEGEAGTNLLQTCRELGVAVTAYSPLSRGLLTGAYSTKEAVSGEGDYRAAVFPRFSDENMATNKALVDRFCEFARRKGCEPGQLALAWLLKQGDDIIPLPGTKKVARLEENLAALNITLTDDEEKEVRQYLESIELKGYRSVEHGRKYAFVDTKQE